MTDLTAVELRELVVAELVPATDTVTVNEAVIVGAGSAGGGGSALTVKEEGTSVDTAVSSINFVGGSQTAAQTASGAVTVTSTAYYPGGTDVPVTDGGTGSSTAAGARTNLGLVIGTDVAAQPSGTPTGSKFYRDDGTWASPGGGVTSVDGNTGAVTASQLLTSIKTVDGTGSGLDADTLDGNDSAAFATAGHNHTGTYQPLDADLTAIAGLTSAADTLPYFTGSATAALTTLSSFMRTLIDDADAATARTTLGLVIGTNVQAYDAELAALASTTSAADKVPYFTGSGTASTTDLTSTARSLLDDTSTSAMRTTLGVAIGTDVQAYNAVLTTLQGLTPTNGNAIVGNGSAWTSGTPTVADPPTVQIIARQTLK